MSSQCCSHPLLSPSPLSLLLSASRGSLLPLSSLSRHYVFFFLIWCPLSTSVFPSLFHLDPFPSSGPEKVVNKHLASSRDLSGVGVEGQPFLQVRVFFPPTDDGKIFHGSGVGDPFGPRCYKGDIMGCGIMFPRDYILDSEGEWGGGGWPGWSGRRWGQHQRSSVSWPPR